MAVAVAVGVVDRSRAIPRMVGCLAVAMLWIPLWQLAMPLAALAWLVTGPRPGLPRGGVPMLPTVASAAVTPVALVGWFLLLQPDLSDIAERYALDQWPLGVLLVGALLFAVTNALGEELIWRGVFHGALERDLGPVPAVAITAVSFGFAHVNGFPRGAVGVLLVAVWGAMLGYTRHRSGGWLAPLLAHVVADGVIAAIAITWL